MATNKLSSAWDKKEPKRYDDLPKAKVNIKQELKALKPKSETKLTKQSYEFGGTV